MSSTTWSIEKNEESGKWYLQFDSIESEDKPSIDEIYLEMRKKGIDPRCMISKAKIAKYIDDALLTCIAPSPLLLQLDPTFDVRVIVAPDKLSARLYVRKAYDVSQALPLNIVARSLQNCKIKDLNMADINSVLSQFEGSADMELDVEIKTGTSPKRGKDRSLIEHFTALLSHEVTRITERLLDPKFREEGEDSPEDDRDFPLSQAEKLAYVEKDSVIYEISQEEPGEAGVDVYGNKVDGLPGNMPFVVDLRNIVQLGDEFRSAITGILIVKEDGKNLKMRIIPYKNAKVKAIVSKDKMSAVLILEDGAGAGDLLSPALIKTALNDAGLLEVTPASKIDEAIKVAKKYEETEFPLLKGVDPIGPGSYLLDWKISFDDGAPVATVQTSDFLLEATKLSKGQEGKDVFGKVIKQKAVHEVFIPEIDDSIKATEEGHVTKFFAAISGELSFIDNKLSIASTRTIEGDINKKGEKISFPGDIVITGDVGDEVTVKAKGNLTCKGYAAISLLYSENVLNLEGGMKGRGRGTLWAKNSMFIGFCEGAKLFAGGNVTINEYCFMCVVKTNGLLSVQGHNGALIGGSIHSARGCVVRNLGAEKSIRTVISFGQDYLIKDEIEVHEKEIEANTAQLKICDAKLADKGLSEKEIDEARKNKVRLMKRNSALQIRIFNLKENFEFHIPSSVKVLGTIYPGVVLESHGRYFEVFEKQSAVEFKFDEVNGNIVSVPIEE